MDTSKSIIKYEGQPAEVIENQLTEEDALLFMPSEPGFPFYVTLVQNGETTTVNFTSLDRNLSIREFIHLCKRNGPISLFQSVSPV